MNLPACYKLIIAPVADLLDGCKIIIVPDHYLYHIPFAALPDQCGKTLSENFKICVAIAPSLTTLRPLLYGLGYPRKPSPELPWPR